MALPERHLLLISLSGFDSLLGGTGEAEQVTRGVVLISLMIGLTSDT